MADAQTSRVKVLFQQAIDLPLDERAEFLEKMCGSDIELRASIQSLLDHDADGTGECLRVPAFQPPEQGAARDGSASGHARQAVVPERIGPFRVIRRIGEGGMGVVYEAEQERPRRRVALKIIRAGIVSSSVVRRFEHEAEILGRLQHPGIARIIEAGSADSGCGPQPYFAMEFIDGEPLNDYVRTRELGTESRINLVLRICDAVEHAHQKGIIHRDLKPANILVDNTGQPKILDFGIARATDADIAAATVKTEIGQLIGTIAYMSPEQAHGRSKDLDTRSDVYSLGVILYELLSHRLPYSTKDKSVAQVLRVIEEEDPAPLGSIDRVFRGDLEFIVDKALEKDKCRRYSSASALAADLRRMQKHEPISVRPRRGWYLFRKFARRNKALVAASVIALMGIALGSTFAVWKAVEATAERNRAVDAEKRARVQRDVAQRESLKAECVNQFMHDVLEAASLVSTRHDLTVRELLDRAARRVHVELSDQPEMEAAVRVTIGNSYMGIGKFDVAEVQLQEALNIYRSIGGDDHPDVPAALYQLAYTLSIKGEFKRAERMLRETLQRYETRYGATHLQVADCLDRLAEVLYEKRDIDEAISARRRALAIRRTLLGSSTDVARTLRELSFLFDENGDYGEAERRIREALAMYREFRGDRDQDAAWTLYTLGQIQLHQGNYTVANETLHETLDVQREVLGGDHVDIAHTLSALAFGNWKERKYSEAEDLYRQSLEMRRSLLGREHLHIARLLHNLGGFYEDIGRLEPAESSLREALRMRRNLRGNLHHEVASSLRNLAVVLRERGNLEEAEALFRENLAVSQNLDLEDDGAVAFILKELGVIARARGDYSGAESLLDRALAIQQSLLDPDQEAIASMLVALADLRLVQGQTAKAEAVAREAVEAYRDGQSLSCLGKVLLADGRAHEAEASLREALDSRRRNLAPNHWRTAECAGLLGTCLSGLAKYDAAETLLLSGHASLAASLGARHPQTRETARRIIELYEVWGKTEERELWRARLSSGE